MSALETLGPFWIIGIVLNVSLTGLAIWWVLKQIRQHPAKVSEVHGGENPPGEGHRIGQDADAH
jgi:hypothetical protein